MQARPTDRTVFQNAWVVDDVEATAMKWMSQKGVGPLFVTEYRGLVTDVTGRGKPVKLDMIVARAQAGTGRTRCAGGRAVARELPAADQARPTPW